MKKLYKIVVFFIFGGIVLLGQNTVKSQIDLVKEEKDQSLNLQFETLSEKKQNDLTKVGFPEWVERP